MITSKYIKKVQSISSQNKYSEQYCLIINNAINRAGSRTDAQIICGYVEEHHILPKSFKLSGEKDKDNYAYLTPKEHFVCHHLLTKMFEGKFKANMIYAFWQMANVRNIHQANRYIPTAKEYEKALLLRKQLTTSDTTREKIKQARIGKIAVYNQVLDKVAYIDECNLNQYINIGFRRGGKPVPVSRAKQISETNLRLGIRPISIGWNKGLTKDTNESIQQMSLKNKGRIPHNKNKTNIELYGKEKATEMLIKNKTKQAIPVIINGVEYYSIIEASRQLGITELKVKIEAGIA